MSEAIVELFAEDRAHEFFIRPLLERIALEEGKALTIRTISARGGHPRVQKEVELYKRLLQQRKVSPDLVVICVDGNCQTAAKARSQLARTLAPELSERAVIACPDPHIERWYLADPASFQSVVGYRPALPRRKCERGRYKRLLADAVRSAGEIAPLGGIEYADELVSVMDFFRASKSDASLRIFLSEAREAIRKL